MTNSLSQRPRLKLPSSGILKYYKNIDLKARLWQLGIDPLERFKTTFCIANAQYQWIVIPFGIIVAPSLFQRSMTKTYEPILHRTLIYLDDMLLFSKERKKKRNTRLSFNSLYISQDNIVSCF